MLGRQKKNLLLQVDWRPAFFVHGMWTFCGNIKPSVCILPMIRRTITNRLFTQENFFKKADSPRSAHKTCCYVLIGYPGDTMENAEKRLRDAWAAGFLPYAMLYRDETGIVNQDWKQFQRLWVRPQIIISRLKHSSEL